MSDTTIPRTPGAPGAPGAPGVPGAPGGRRARHAKRPAQSSPQGPRSPKDPGGTGTPGADDARPAGLWSDAWHDLRRRPLFVASAVLIGVILLMAVVPQLFTSVDPYDAVNCRLGDARQAPSADHWFGTDNQGCDTFARTVYGTRVSLLVGLSATVVTVLVGGLLGLLAGFRGGWPDALLSRVAEIFFAIPSVLGALLILAVFRTGTVWTVMLALSMLAWPMTFRIMRAAVITAKGQDYVIAARALGASGGRLMFRHILPNSVASVIVVATINLGVFIAAEAGLSFLGVGIQSPSISWGLMIADARPRFLEAAGPLLFPAAFLSVTVLAFIMLGDAVRDALDPKLR
ncbi:ABC transporter permease [Planobispora rosea]|uniref:ABC transporter permease n=1 Tax=Planobispora rosea TaxID=35762 RepID=UPI0009FDE5CC|nr:ABC transporter permease [Planobispora rosea]